MVAKQAVNEKANSRQPFEAIEKPAFFGAGEEIRTLDPNLGKR